MRFYPVKPDRYPRIRWTHSLSEWISGGKPRRRNCGRTLTIDRDFVIGRATGNAVAVRSGGHVYASAFSGWTGSNDAATTAFIMVMWDLLPLGEVGYYDPSGPHTYRWDTPPMDHVLRCPELLPRLAATAAYGGQVTPELVDMVTVAERDRVQWLLRRCRKTGAIDKPSWSLRRAATAAGVGLSNGFSPLPVHITPADTDRLRALHGLPPLPPLESPLPGVDVETLNNLRQLAVS
jgi:hypothetical protein